MVTRTRKTIRAAMEEVDIKYSTLGFALKRIQHLVEKYGENADIDTYQYPYSDSESLYVYANRPETDVEMVNRIRQEEEYERRQADYDRREYERLKAKFESK